MTFWDLVDKHINSVFSVIVALGFFWMIVKLFNAKDE